MQISVGTGPTITAVSGKLIPKFGLYGVPITHSGLLMDSCPEDTILVGPTTRSLLPGMYKIKEFKEVAGVGLAHKLEVINS